LSKRKAMLLKDWAPKEQNRVQNIVDVLFCDSQIMNFGSFLPGKFLGSTLIVANKTECEQIIELSVDGTNYKYKKDELA